MTPPEAYQAEATLRALSRGERPRPHELYRQVAHHVVRQRVQWNRAEGETEFTGVGDGGSGRHEDLPVLTGRSLRPRTPVLHPHLEEYSRSID